MGYLAATFRGLEIWDAPASLFEASISARISGFQSEVLGVLGNVSKNLTNTSENCNKNPPTGKRLMWRVIICGVPLMG